VPTRFPPPPPGRPPPSLLPARRVRGRSPQPGFFFLFVPAEPVFAKSPSAYTHQAAGWKTDGGFGCFLPSQNRRPKPGAPMHFYYATATAKPFKAHVYFRTDADGEHVLGDLVLLQIRRMAGRDDFADEAEEEAEVAVEGGGSGAHAAPAPAPVAFTPGRPIRTPTSRGPPRSAGARATPRGVATPSAPHPGATPEPQRLVGMPGQQQCAPASGTPAATPATHGSGHSAPSATGRKRTRSVGGASAAVVTASAGPAGAGSGAAASSTRALFSDGGAHAAGSDDFGDAYSYGGGVYSYGFGGPSTGGRTSERALKRSPVLMPRSLTIVRVGEPSEPCPHPDLPAGVGVCEARQESPTSGMGFSFNGLTLTTPPPVGLHSDGSSVAAGASPRPFQEGPPSVAGALLALPPTAATPASQLSHVSDASSATACPGSQDPPCHPWCGPKPDSERMLAFYDDLDLMAASPLSPGPRCSSGTQ
jgi:hypothetical protein